MVRFLGRSGKSISRAGILVLAGLVMAPGMGPVSVHAGPSDTDSAYSGLLTEYEDLLAQMRSVSIQEPYVVIDTYDNQLVVRSREKVLRTGPCATGSGRKLLGEKAWHRWQFDTPRGRFSVIRKTRDPIWVRPAWDFIESGEEIPVFAEDPRRFARGVLGEYALYFRPGFMIHGTLFETNLGRSITHGCVRVGAEYLRDLYQTVRVGWPVYIY